MKIENDLRLGWNRLRQHLDIGQRSTPGATVQAAASAQAPALSELFPRLARYRLLIVTGLALFLVWEVVTRGVAAYLAEDNPEAALWLRSTQPTALTKLADERLNPKPKAEQNELSQQAGQETSSADKPVTQGTDVAQERSAEQAFPGSIADTTKDLDEIKAWAVLALRNDPLNARALRILGQLAQRTDQKQADALMQAAAERSLHESFAVYSTMLKSYREADYRATLRYADILLRTRNLARPYVMPIVAKLAETPEASDQLKALLAKNPPWRPQFFNYLPRGVSDARTPLDIFLSLRDTSTPPTSTDLRSYLDFLIQHGFHDLAYYAWLQFLPPEQLSKVGRLFNGNFQTAPSGLPFDWVFTGGNGVTLQVAERPDEEGDNALLMEFGPGRVEFGGVTQLVLLPPGSYQLKGKYKSDLVSQRGLQWRVLCGSKSLGESRPVTGTEPAWEDFVVSFTVPEDCPAQKIKLALDARSASETFVSGSIWYDDLSITRAPEAEQTLQ